jgi:hypothetical protein
MVSARVSKRSDKHYSHYLLAVLVLSSNQANAAENSQMNQQQQPNLELLEFLGSFATDEGEWIDPNSLLEEEFSSLIDSIAAQAASTRPQPNNPDNQDSAND